MDPDGAVGLPHPVLGDVVDVELDVDFGVGFCGEQHQMRF